MIRTSNLRRSLLVAAYVSLITGCGEDTERSDDPPLAVPGQVIPDAPVPPIGVAAGMPGSEVREWDPPLAVPGYATLPDPPPPPMPAIQPGGPIALAPGFTPDPIVMRGVAGGPVAASALSPQCRGYVTPEPSHVVQLASDFAMLRVLVSSEQDTTLVIRGPAGDYRCADDNEGLNPIITGAFGRGAYSVWVGSYQQGGTARYAIGFSEIPAVTTLAVGQAAQSMQP